MTIELVILAIALAVIFKPKSIHIDFTGRGDDDDRDDEPKPHKQVKPRNNRKQLKK